MVSIGAEISLFPVDQAFELSVNAFKYRQSRDGIGPRVKHGLVAAIEQKKTT